MKHQWQVIKEQFPVARNGRYIKGIGVYKVAEANNRCGYNNIGNFSGAVTFDNITVNVYGVK